MNQTLKSKEVKERSGFRLVHQLFRTTGVILGYYFSLFSEIIKSSFPVPLSLILVIVMVFNLWRIRIEFNNGERIEGNEPPLNVLKNHGVCLVLLVIFLPMLMIMIYGATDYSVSNAKKIMENRGWQQPLSVSHNYHLLRINLAADQIGLNTYTVPVKNSGLISYEFWSVVREISALYYYYFFKGGNSDA